MPRFALPAALLAAASASVFVSAAPASAAFDAPVELGSGDYRTSVAGATDAAGTTTAILTGAGGPRLVQRPAGGPWTAPQPLPGTPNGVAGPVVVAAGTGAAALAWRVDRPKKFTGIMAAVRDPGGAAFGLPQTIAGAADGGVRYPAIAIDPEGRSLLAYNTGTRAVHLSLRGGIAIALRPRGGPFGAPVIVDPEPSRAPAVALAPDGTGVVAWTRARRVWAVTVDVGAGTISPPAAVSGAGAHGSLVATAGPGGAATLAWLMRHQGRYGIEVVRAAGSGEPFGRAQTLGEGTRFIRALGGAADPLGITTLAWSPERFSRDHSQGINGITSSVVSASAGRAGAFGPVRTLLPRGDAVCSTPSVAAAGAGRAAVAWICLGPRGRSELQAAVGRPRGAAGLGPVQSIAAAQLSRPAPGGEPTVHASLDAQGAATILFVRPDPAQARLPTTERVLVTTGR